MSHRDRLEATCPHCQGQALFIDPFEFTTVLPTDQPARRWGGWYVVERYPQLLPWQAPAGSSSQHLLHGSSHGQGYVPLTRGVVECQTCQAPFVHLLNWPQDAWWQWSVRGRLLWAWDRDHARRIVEYVRATDRPRRGVYGDIANLPAYFLAAKQRDTVIKLIERTLHATH